MATFTTNSSQKTFGTTSTANGIFDKAFAFSFFLVVVVGGLWATERILIYLADRQITNYQATTTASLESVNPEDVQAVHDVTSRLAALQLQGATNMKTGEALAALERATIPQVKLTEFEYINDGLAFIKGNVSDYRFLAEQILRYRQEAIFATAEVTTTGRTDAGQVTFEIRVEPPAQETSAVPSAETAPAL